MMNTLLVIYFAIFFSVVEASYSGKESLFLDTKAVGQKCHRRMDCTCGPKKVPTRIVGGKEAIPHSYPWLASLIQLDGEISCGAALINDRYVLTAAHCLTSFTTETLRVVMGHHDLKKLREATVYHADKFITYPKYEDLDPYQKYDIALVRLRERITFSDNIYPVCLPGRDFPAFNYPNLVVAGFGQLKEDGVRSDRLLDVNLPEVNNTECTRLLHSIRITDDHLCAGNGTKDACQGDSGGPLITTDGRSWFIAGIVSWGVACAHKVYPGVFTRVWSYAKWISDNTMDAKYCNNRKAYNEKDYVPCPFRIP